MNDDTVNREALVKAMVAAGVVTDAVQVDVYGSARNDAAGYVVAVAVVNGQHTGIQVEPGAGNAVVCVPFANVADADAWLTRMTDEYPDDLGPCDVCGAPGVYDVCDVNRMPDGVQVWITVCGESCEAATSAPDADEIADALQGTTDRDDNVVISSGAYVIVASVDGTVTVGLYTREGWESGADAIRYRDGLQNIGAVRAVVDQYRGGPCTVCGTRPRDGRAIVGHYAANRHDVVEIGGAR